MKLLLVTLLLLCLAMYLPPRAVDVLSVPPLPVHQVKVLP